MKSWYIFAVLANSGRIFQSSAVSQSVNHNICFFIVASLMTFDCPKWNFNSSKKWQSSRGLEGSKAGAPWSLWVGIGGTTGWDIVASYGPGLGWTGDVSGGESGDVSIKGVRLSDLEFRLQGGGEMCDSWAKAGELNSLWVKGCGVPSSLELK